jgi:hypothetical protein
MIFIGISCHKEHSPNLLKIEQIKFDTLCGYPYPSNYNWIEWVKKGNYNSIPSKNKFSWEPLVNFMKTPKDEIYRFNFGLIKCIVFADSNLKEIVIQKDSVLKWNNQSPWIFPDSIVKVTHKIELSKQDWNKTIKLIYKVNLFSKMTIDSEPRFIDDGYDYELEGIKDGYYNLIVRILPDKSYERELFKLGNWLLKILGEKPKNG